MCVLNRFATHHIYVHICTIIHICPRPDQTAYVIQTPRVEILNATSRKKLKKYKAGVDMYTKYIKYILKTHKKYAQIYVYIYIYIYMYTWQISFETLINLKNIF